MKFGPVPVDDALGATLAHSLSLEGARLRKGRALTAEDIDKLRQADMAEVIVARLDDGDLDEDAAAAMLAEPLKADHARLSRATTGRVNLIAETAGLITVDTAAINAANAVDEAVTLATLPDMMRVDADQLLATLKIIPYGVAGEAVQRAAQALGQSPVKLHPFKNGHARLILTRTPGFTDSLIKKGRLAVAERIEALGWTLNDTVIVDHAPDAIAEALEVEADLILILAASATSDRADVTPAAIERAGGQVLRVGMPVDPGNLLVLGQRADRPILGLPGCARSPALNGTDWVLERFAAGLRVTSQDIAAMGVGGLLKEMPDRPTPRRTRRQSG